MVLSRDEEHPPCHERRVRRARRKFRAILQGARIGDELHRNPARLQRIGQRLGHPRRDAQHLPFPLIADTDGKVAGSFHVPMMPVIGVPMRQSFLIKDGKIALQHSPGLGVSLDSNAVAELAALELRESPFYDDIEGEAPSVGQIL